jgi:urease accessory protein
MRLLLSIALLLVSFSAQAHTGAGQAAGFASGFGHPLGGVDHVLAMSAIGVFAATLGGRALWATPLAFMTFMVVGGAAGMAGLPLPFVELGIALSIVVLGLAIAARWHWPVMAAAALAAVFAIFHGHAHGTEMPLGAAAFAYAAGFVAATGLLHLAGLAVAMRVFHQTQAMSGRAVQLGGGAISILGVGVLAGLI